jgi:hypothetical protein
MIFNYETCYAKNWTWVFRIMMICRFLAWAYLYICKYVAWASSQAWKSEQQSGAYWSNTYVIYGTVGTTGEPGESEILHGRREDEPQMELPVRVLRSTSFYVLYRAAYYRTTCHTTASQHSHTDLPDVITTHFLPTLFLWIFCYLNCIKSTIDFSLRCSKVCKEKTLVWQKARCTIIHSLFQSCHDHRLL